MHEKVESIKTSLGWIDVAWSGEGRTTLVEMHGWCSSRFDFEPLNKHLEPTYRIAAIDWPGHGTSQKPRADFTTADMRRVAADVVRDVTTDGLVLVAAGYSGWIALDLCRQLGGRVEALVFLNWDMIEPSPATLEAFAQLQTRATAEAARDRLIETWMGAASVAEVAACLKPDQAGPGIEMWQRAGREIARSYRREGAPLSALAQLPQPPRALHLYSLPTNDDYWQVQKEFSETHPWFQAERLSGRTALPALEMPHDVAAAIGRFLQPQTTTVG
jgi:pimeloyl-ACP methyl ester carboxylesterase